MHRQRARAIRGDGINAVVLLGQAIADGTHRVQEESVERFDIVADQRLLILLERGSDFAQHCGAIIGANAPRHARAASNAALEATAPNTPPCILTIFSAARWLP